MSDIVTNEIIALSKQFRFVIYYHFQQPDVNWWLGMQLLPDLQGGAFAL